VNAARRARSADAAPCPCGGRPAGAPFEACCGRYLGHFDDAPAPDAEALMRSRYSAFARQDAAYLRATWHPSTRPAQLALETGTHWLGLQVRAHRLLDDTRAEVEFVARSRVGGGPVWASNTAGRTLGVAAMQGDGNLVVYDAASVPRFNTMTNGTPGAQLFFEAGRLHVIAPNGTRLWSSP